MKTCLQIARIQRLAGIIAGAAFLLAASATPIHAQCNCTSFNLVNGDFEQPPVAPGSLTFFNGPAYPGWETTDPTNLIEVWGTGHNGVPSQSGGALVELNAYNFASVFQDVSTCPGQIYSWSVAHRGRLGVETAALEFGPPGGPFTTAQTMTDGTSAWVVYSGFYTVPGGQTTTRIRLTSITASGQSVGNLVDNFRMIPVSTLQCPGNISVNSDPGMCSAVVSYSEPATSQGCNTCGPNSLAGYTLLGDFGGHRYFVSTSSTTWTGAQTTANATGGHLATIGSAAENAFVTGALGSIPNAWIGLNDATTEGVFVWENGEPVTFTNWCPGEPNNLGNEDYTTISWCSPGIWNDLPNSSVQPFVLEFDCTGPVRTAGPPSGSAFPVGTTTVSYSSTDPLNNTQTCSFTITVVDKENPVARCQDATVTLVSGTATATPAMVDKGSDDNCGVVSLTLSPSTFDCDDIGDQPVTLTVTDGSGNSSSCTAIVHVLGAVPSCTIAAVPANTTFTGGNPNNIYLGYGPQSVALTQRMVLFFETGTATYFFARFPLA